MASRVSSSGTPKKRRTPSRLRKARNVIGSSSQRAAYHEAKPVVSLGGASTSIQRSPLVTSPSLTRTAQEFHHARSGPRFPSQTRDVLFQVLSPRTPLPA